MRASRARPRQGPEHISGAERIVAAAGVPGIAAELARRALSHPKGQPDSIHISVEALDEDTLERLEPDRERGPARRP